MKTYIYQRLWLRKTVGILLIVFGVLGMILPIIPGAIFAVIGLEFVGIRLAFFDRFYPKRALPTLAQDEVSVPV